MRSAKRFGRSGFLAGFIGPVLFYVAHVELRILWPPTPLCIFVAFAHPLSWLQIGLAIGLLQGLTFALVGFVLGYSALRLRS